MPTYVYRCKTCKTDWQRVFKIKSKPPRIKCPVCPREYAFSVITAIPVIFTDRGFPGNDMKNLVSGVSAGSVGNKPSHKEMEYIEKKYPDVHKPNTERERFMDQARTGSKHKSFGRR